MDYKSLLWIFILGGLLTVTHQSIYQKYYSQAYSIAVAMTIDQKIGQTIQADFYSITNKNNTDPAQAAKFHLGSLLVGGDGAPDQNGNLIQMPNMDEQKTIAIYANATMEKWQKLSQKFDYSINITTNQGKTYSIKPLLGTDAVHNNQHIAGTILFPHNIGLSCSHNPQNFYNSGKWTGINVKQSGFNYAFAPTVAVSHNPQWGRYYETMGQEPEMIYEYAKSYTQGLQGKPDALTGILGSVKHFIGDGATLYGADQGNARVSSMGTFIKHNVQGYNGSIAAQIGSVMCSYSGINWLPNALAPMLNTVLRQKLSFDGFVISDYDELNRVIDQQLPTDLQTFNFLNGSVSSLLNAGYDMIMIPSKGGFQDYINNVKMGLQNKTLEIDRLNDAVARIVSVKLALGVAKNSANEKNMRKNWLKSPKKNWDSSEYEDSLQAVHQSLVLLKNSNTIPVKVSSLQYIVLVGEKIININNLAKNELFRSYDNIGMQSGGWSLRWNGFEGNSQWLGDNKKLSNASSIQDALLSLNEKFELISPNYTTLSEKAIIQIERQEYLNKLKTLRKKMTSKNTIILAVTGESPYAEFAGDVGIPYCQNSGALGGDGCLFDYQTNPYMEQKQRSSLQLDFAKFDQDVIDHIREQDKNIPLLTVLLAGRPMLIDKILSQSSAVLDAFLPGTSGGQGIVDAITGNYILRKNGSSDRINSLSFDWPKSNDQLKQFPIYRADGKVPAITDPLFKVGYGLSSFTG